MTTSFFIYAATTTILLLLLSPTPTTADFIVDENGEYVLNGGSYHIFPDMVGNGGLSWTPNNSTECPLYIKPKLDNQGTSVRIFSPFLLPYIRLSTPVVFTFDGVNTPCMRPLSWLVTTDDASNQSYVVAGGGHAVGSLFTIQKTESKNGKENVYKIDYCKEQAKGCLDVGLVKEDGLLGITPDEPLPIIFVKNVPQPSSSFM